MISHILQYDYFGLIKHLPILQVLIPFIAAPLIVFIGKRNISFWLTFLASILSLIIAGTLLVTVQSDGIVSYHIGGWAPPIGIEYRIDHLSAFVLILISLVSTLVLPYIRSSILYEIPKDSHTLFYAAYLLCLTGLLGVVATGDAFNVFVFLEISSLSSYVLVSLGSYRDRRAFTAAFEYLIMGTIGATFFVIGIGLLYMETGTLNLVDMSDILESQSTSRTVTSAFAFIVVGIGLKLAIYPIHLWLPRAYTFAPSAVSAFLAATATKVAVYMLIRFMFTVFKPSFLSEMNVLEFFLLPLAILAMIITSIIAIFQKDLKSLLAYSSVAQIGYILLGLTLLSEKGLTASIIHLFNHGITKLTLFMIAGAYVVRRGGSLLKHLEGAAGTMPWTSAAAVIGFLSLIGVPGTAGFISKWLLVEASLEKGLWLIAILIILSSLLAVIYCWKIVETIYFKDNLIPSKEGEIPKSMLIPIWVSAIACIYFGLNTDITISIAEIAAQTLQPNYVNNN